MSCRYRPTEDGQALRHQRGVSLVELMVALTLGLVVLATVLSAYLNTRRTLANAEERISRQQDARYAVQTLARDVRMAGELGCLSLAEASGSIVNAVASAAPWRQLAATGAGVAGLAQASATGNTWFGGSGMAPVGEVLIVQYGQLIGPVASYSVASGQLAQLSFPVASQSDWKAWGTVVVSSCGRADVLAVGSGGVTVSTGASGSTLTLAHALPLASGAVSGHQPGSLEVLALVSRAYFIAASGGVRSLWRMDLKKDGTRSVPALVASGVDQWQVEYGIRSACNASGPRMVFRADAAGVAQDEWPRLALLRLQLAFPYRDAAAASATLTYQANVALRSQPPCGGERP